MSRRNGRVLTFQALYSYDVGGVPLEELLKFNWDESFGEEPAEPYKPEEEDYARLLITGTINHIDEVDSIIEKHLSDGWNLDRINKVVLAILRMSVYSLLYQKDIPPSVVIDEAVSISDQYGTDVSFRFVNAILDTIQKELKA